MRVLNALKGSRRSYDLGFVSTLADLSEPLRPPTSFDGRFPGGFVLLPVPRTPLEERRGARMAGDCTGTVDSALVIDLNTVFDDLEELGAMRKHHNSLQGTSLEHLTLPQAAIRSLFPHDPE